MTQWVALLRGVNVGGITVRSAELADLFRSLGFSAVKTVLASGNVLFSTDAAVRGALKAHIEQALRERFGYDAWIVLVTQAELAAAAQAFPFDAADVGRQPYVIFCSDESVREELLAVAASLDVHDDPVAPGPGVIFWNPEKGRSVDTEFARTLGKLRYTSCTTTRNLRTVLKMLG